MVEETSLKAICFKHDAKISILFYPCKCFSVYLDSFDDFTSFILAKNTTDGFYKFLCVITFDFDDIGNSFWNILAFCSLSKRLRRVKSGFSTKIESKA